MKARIAILIAFTFTLSSCDNEKIKESYGDLALYDLRGYVANVIYTATLHEGNTQTDTLSFDEDGILLDDDGNSIDHIYKNDSLYYEITRSDSMLNRPIETYIQDFRNSKSCYKTYVYNRQRQLITAKESTDEYEYVTRFTYDNNGYIINQVRSGRMLDENGEMTDISPLETTYEYISFDDNGNWTERKCVSSTLSNASTYVTEEYREIEYY